MFVELVHSKCHAVQVLAALFAVEAGRMEGVGVGADDFVGDRLEAGSALLQSLLCVSGERERERERVS